MFKEGQLETPADPRDLREYLSHQVELAKELLNRDISIKNTSPNQNIEEKAMRNWIDNGYAKSFHEEVAKRAEKKAPWPTIDDVISRRDNSKNEERKAA